MTLIRTAPFRWPYSLSQLRQDEPSRSFSNAPSDAELAHYNVYRVMPQDRPEFDPATHRLIEAQPLEQGGQWLQQWEAVELTEAEQEAYYRATNPPQWLAFAAVAQADPAVNKLLAAALTKSPALAMSLPLGLSKAADGDAGVFLGAWQAAKSMGLVSADLAAALQMLATQYHLPAEFVEGLA